jgi:probable F420-dependent oxidoreductase
MKFGVVFPQTEFGSDPAAVRDFAQTAEGMGFSHVVAYDHVIGANPVRPGGWRGPYTHESSFLEPFVLFSYMAAVTQKMGFMTGILILPQRQTVLVAKQAATLDVFCNGRFRLGVGLGWNEVEYTALNQDFHTRGKRLEEQIALLRQLWTQPLVTFQGTWDSVPDAGLKPLPVQRPIPIWIGGVSEPALRRTARMADGWLPMYRTIDEARQASTVIRKALDDAGRDPSELGIEPRIAYGDGNPQTWQKWIQAWQSMGVSQFSVNTLGAGFSTPRAHLDALRTFVETIEITPA